MRFCLDGDSEAPTGPTCQATWTYFGNCDIRYMFCLDARVTCQHECSHAMSSCQGSDFNLSLSILYALLEFWLAMLSRAIWLHNAYVNDRERRRIE